jgi:hypothetical protein
MPTGLIVDERVVLISPAYADASTYHVDVAGLSCSAADTIIVSRTSKGREPMYRKLSALTICILMASQLSRNEMRAAEPQRLVRGVLVRAEKVTPEFLRAWKAKGVTDVIVPLDEVTKQRWETTARAVEQAGMSLWPWIEVARNPAMADAHPEWMATPGGHHDDWRRRFPNAPTPKAGEVIKVWPWVPIGYAPAFDAHRQRLKDLLGDLPGAWSGVFLNDLQAAPSSCGCGNDQCRWALDYGAPSTATKTTGDDGAAIIVAELSARHLRLSSLP